MVFTWGAHEHGETVHRSQAFRPAHPYGNKRQSSGLSVGIPSLLEIIKKKLKTDKI
jgi:hypothetical protein